MYGRRAMDDTQLEIQIKFAIRNNAEKAEA